MKKLLTLFLLASAMLAAGATNRITLTGGSGHPGDEVLISIAMDGTDDVTAIELKVPLGDYLSYVDGSCALNAGRSDGHTISAAVVSGWLKIYAYSLGLKPFKGTSGELLTFRLKLGDAPGGFTLAPEVMMSDATGASLTSEVQAGTATILCPALRVQTEQINFGHVPIRSSYTRQLTLQNYGNEPMTIHNITASDDEISISPTTLTIPANSSMSTTVTYSPLKRTPFSATLTIESDAVNGKPYNRWQTAKVVADPYSVNELHVVGASGASDSEVEIALKMNNMEPIVGAQVSFQLPAALKYVEGSAQMTSRSDGHVVMATVDEDNKLMLLVYSASNKPLHDDDGDFCTFRVLLNGKSGYYYLSPQNVILSNAAMENMTSATSSASVRIQSPTISGNSLLSFGEQDQTKPLTTVYNIKNSGQAPLTIEKVSFLADGYSVKTQLPLTVEPYQSAEIEIEYLAPQAGQFQTTMNIYSNDPATRVKPVSISGTAFSPNELTLSGQRGEGVYNLSVLLQNDAPLTAVQFTLTPSLPLQGEGDVTLVPSARLNGHSANVYKMEDGTLKVLVFSMNNTAINGNEGELLTLSIPTSLFDGEPTFALSNVVLSSQDGRNLLSPNLTLPQEFEFPPLGSGDTNGDGVVNITDVVNLISYINSGEQPGVVFLPQFADANGDGQLNITDVVKIIEIINKQ